MNFDGLTYNAVAPVTPDDFRSLATLSHKNANALWVGGAGDVTVIGIDGVSATIASVPAGTLLPIYVAKVMATGTTATKIVALYKQMRKQVI